MVIFYTRNNDYINDWESKNMYLVSIYFDDKTDNRIRQYMKQVAQASGNSYMLDGNVPPHMTISAFETKQEELVIEVLNENIPKLTSGELTWASIGQFLPYVLFLSPVLNEYLHGLSEAVYTMLDGMEDTAISKYYQPFQWMPHTTVGKKLSSEEMLAGFQVLQKSFGIFSGQVVKIGLARTNPYRDIAAWELK